MIPTIPGRDPYSNDYDERQDAQECGADDARISDSMKSKWEGKKYKMLKDLPGVPAGGVYVANEYGLVSIFYGGYEYTWRASCFADFFEPVRWRPDAGEEFYYVTTAGKIGRSTWIGNISDNEMLAFGNCFQTQQKAEEAIEAIKEMLMGMAG